MSAFRSKVLTVIVMGLIVVALILIAWSAGVFDSDPFKELIDRVDCGRLDLGGGTVTFACDDGTMWTGVPFELGEKAQ